MLTCADCEPRLSDFVDGTLPVRDRDGVDQHLDTCEPCAGLVRDFERIRRAARSLGPIEPPPNAWPALAARLQAGQAPPARLATLRRPVWQWAGLAATIVFIAASNHAFSLIEPTAPLSISPGAPDSPIAAIAAIAPVDVVAQAMQHYDTAIAELQAMATAGTTTMDPAVAATLEKSLGVVNAAIAESRTALTRDPASLAARDSLFEALQQKVSVLQDTVTIMSDTRQTDAAAGLAK